MSLRLGVNIDHAATLRQARYARDPESNLIEPDPVAAALIAEQAGADGITAHLREDRRHMQDHDIVRLQSALGIKLNLEMANAAEVIDFAVKIHPEEACLVPENRDEVTTEGGLDCLAHADALTLTIRRLQEVGTVVSLFVDPTSDQIQMAAKLGAELIELHTGAFANATGQNRKKELDRLIGAARLAHEVGLSVNAGHGLNYQNIGDIFTVPYLEEVNIGHAIISRALFSGLSAAVLEMKEACARYGQTQ